MVTRIASKELGGVREAMWQGRLEEGFLKELTMMGKPIEKASVSELQLQLNWKTLLLLLVSIEWHQVLFFNWKCNAYGIEVAGLIHKGESDLRLPEESRLRWICSLLEQQNEAAITACRCVDGCDARDRQMIAG